MKFLKTEYSSVYAQMKGGGELQNFTNWPVKFGTIFRGKLWALVINSNLSPISHCY